jgi:glucose/arabinose dehydrogenase
VNIVRKASSDQEISIHAGSFKQRGNQDGIGTDARITRPRGIAVAEDGVVYLADEAASINVKSPQMEW